MRLPENKKENAIIKDLLQAFFIQYALFVQFSEPLLRTNFEETIDYYLAEAAALLGTYHFYGILGFVMAFGFLRYLRNNQYHTMYKGLVLPVFFAFCLLMGQSYAEQGSWDYCFGSLVNFVKFLAAMAGLSILLQKLIGLLYAGYEYISRKQMTGSRLNGFFGAHTFRNVFLLLLVIWAPVILLSYPGNLCYDVIGQIYQGLGLVEYSAHHPLLHTLLISGVLRLFLFLTGSLDVGLFVYIWLQAAALGSGLAATVAYLQKKKVSNWILTIITGIYACAPVYSNVVSTALKDVPFMAAVLWYLVLLAKVVEQRNILQRPAFAALFAGVQVLVALLRNNGFYMVLLTGIILTVLWWKSQPRSGKIWSIGIMVLAPAVLYVGINGMLIGSLSAKEGSAREMFSVPFQQTARYLQLYGEELSPAEEAGIEGVLGDWTRVAASYDPDIADPVKNLYLEDVGIEDLLAYVKAWFIGFCKHPMSYVEAFFVHVYGWFDPGVSNNIRYEAVDSLFMRKGLFENADKVLVFIYRLLDRITPISLLQNAGIYTWGLFILAGMLLKKKSGYIAMLVPLFISLLICMASPCFYMHLRYAFPIMFGLPFIWGLCSDRQEEGL